MVGWVGVWLGSQFLNFHPLQTVNVIWWVEGIFCWIFDFFRVVWKLFKEYLDIVFGLTLSCVFTALKVDTWPRKLRFSVNNLLMIAFFVSHFWPIWGVKKVVFWIFVKLFGSCLGSVWASFFSLKRPTFSPLGSRKALKNGITMECAPPPPSDIVNPIFPKDLVFDGAFAILTASCNFVVLLFWLCVPLLMEFYILETSQYQ